MPTQREDGFLSIKGVRLEYSRYDDKDNDKTTLVFLHEGLGSLAAWKDFPMRVHLTTGCNIFIYSRQSYGRSDPLPDPRDRHYLEYEATVVLPAVLEAAGIKRPLLIGHSDGATLALIYAATAQQAAPLALVLMAAHVFVEDLSLKGIREARRAYENGSLRQQLAAYHDDVDNAFWRWNAIWLEQGFSDWNIEKLLPAISAPVLHIQGENDEYGSAAQADAIAAACSGKVELLMLADCGHSPWREQAQTCLQAISAFVSTADRTLAGNKRLTRKINVAGKIQ